MPDYISPDFVKQITQMYKNNKELFESPVVYYLGLALHNPILAVQMMSNQYLYAIVKSLLNQEGPGHVQVAKGYLTEVYNTVSSVEVGKLINWNALKSDVKMVREETQIQDKEIDKLMNKIISEEKKK